VVEAEALALVCTETVNLCARFFPLVTPKTKSEGA